MTQHGAGSWRTGRDGDLGLELDSVVDVQRAAFAHRRIVRGGLELVGSLGRRDDPLRA
jgi:hypothetical protein